MDYRIRAKLTKNWYGALDLADMTADVYYFEGNDELLESVPFKYEVCQTCRGTGFYTDPNVDSHGITQDEWEHWSSDEQENYFNGAYDTPCATCDSNCVVPIVDPSRATQTQIDLVEKVIAINTEYAVQAYNEAKYGY